MADRVWNAQQRAIRGWFAKDDGAIRDALAVVHGDNPFANPPAVDVEGHLVVEALAGTGKSTTILWAIEAAPESTILLAAFNKIIADHLQAELRNPRAQAKTLHGVGFACVGRYWERLRVNNDIRTGRAVTLTQEVCGDYVPDPMKRLITKLHTKAREIHPLAQSRVELEPIARQFDLEPDDTWEQAGWTTARVCGHAYDAMVLAAEKKPVAIDFADMIYLPIRNNWLVPMYELVVIDEAQDMSASQLLLARGVAAGRIAVIGDANQAVYSFRGADSGSIARLKAELHASTLGLHTTYRCGRAIVALAKTIVPTFEAGAMNPDGVIEHLGGYDALVKTAEPGDFVLSRKNAPLAGVAMAFIRARKRVVVKGKDIGAGLIALVDQLAKGPAAHDIDAFLARLNAWRDTQVARALKAEDEARAEQVEDKAETLTVIATDSPFVPDMRRLLDELFTDTSNAATVVTCSSVHKAKGLEAERVFVLTDTMIASARQQAYFDAHPDPARDREEENIRYVAYTRAKSTLVLVTSKAPAQPPPPALPLTSEPAKLLMREVVMETCPRCGVTAPANQPCPTGCGAEPEPVVSPPPPSAVVPLPLEQPSVGDAYDHLIMGVGPRQADHTPACAASISRLDWRCTCGLIVYDEVPS